MANAKGARRGRGRLGALLALGAAAFLGAQAARAADLVFLSTQLRPIEEAQKVREVILHGFSGDHVTYVTEQPAQLPVRMRAEREAGGGRTVSAIGALHGELQPLVPTGALAPLDDLAGKLAGRGIPANLMALGRYGGEHQLYIPWMQATYIMVARKEALPYLPQGADINALTYDQLTAWADAIKAKTGRRVLGFPAGPQGLLPRLFEGYLYPSFTGGLVRTFRSPDAEAMWTWLQRTWASANPNSTSYNFMQEPLLSGDVWIAWDHVARVLDALRRKPDDFVAFPAPAGPKGRGIMPVLAGLAVAEGAPDAAGAASLVEYLTRPDVQITTLRAVGFFPVVDVALPADLDPGIRLEAEAVARGQQAKDLLTVLLPVGLGSRGGEFDKVFVDTFQRVVLRGEKPRPVLDRQAEALRRIMQETGAPCWQPDAPSQGACPVE